MLDDVGGPVRGSFSARPLVHREPPTYPAGWPLGERIRSWRSSVSCAVDGSGHLRLRPGDYVIRAHHPGGTLVEQRIVSVPASGEEVFLAHFQVGRTGRLLDGEGNPLVNWGIEARGERGRPHKTITAADGEFEFSGPGGHRLRVLGVHPCGLKVELFDSELGSWPVDGILTVELHRVRISVLDLRAGALVPFHLSVGARGTNTPVDETLGSPVFKGDGKQAITLRLPAGVWVFAPSHLRPSSAVQSLGGEYMAQVQLHSITNDQEITFIATHYAQPQFVGSWGNPEEQMTLSWTAVTQGRQLAGTISHPATPFSSSLIPLGEVDLEITRGNSLWSGSRRVVVMPDGRVVN